VEKRRIAHGRGIEFPEGRRPRDIGEHDRHLTFGGRTPPAAAAAASLTADERDPDDDEVPVELVEDGKVHEPYMLPPIFF
jgi:hypothetical protein